MIRVGLIPFWWDVHQWYGLTRWWDPKRGQGMLYTWGPFKWWRP